jgi:hypothetical protein
MKTQTKTIKEIIISEEEARTFLTTLQYVRHRLMAHNSQGALLVGKLDYVQGLINELEEVI